MALTLGGREMRMETTQVLAQQFCQIYRFPKNV